MPETRTFTGDFNSLIVGSTFILHRHFGIKRSDRGVERGAWRVVRREERRITVEETPLKFEAVRLWPVFKTFSSRPDAEITLVEGSPV